MKIGGLIPFSLLDYPGRIAAVVFTKGCNFICPYCHNPELLSREISPAEIESADVFDFLSARTARLDGVVISGGEPTIHTDLADFTRKIKSMGFLVKLDTNGSNPGSLSLLIKSGLLDYIAMDIKTEPGRYWQAVKAPVERETLLKSIRLIRDFPDYEFRTTVVPGITGLDDLHAIAAMLRSERADKNFVLQHFRPGRCLDSRLDDRKPYREETLDFFMKKIGHYFAAVTVR